MVCQVVQVAALVDNRTAQAVELQELMCFQAVTDLLQALTGLVAVEVLAQQVRLVSATQAVLVVLEHLPSHHG
jgi:hypothetical protein